MRTFDSVHARKWSETTTGRKRKPEASPFLGGALEFLLEDFLLSDCFSMDVPYHVDGCTPRFHADASARALVLMTANRALFAALNLTVLTLRQALAAAFFTNRLPSVLTMTRSFLERN